jgi:hypothetical protein
MSTTTCPTCRAVIDVPHRTRDGSVTCGGCGHTFVPTAAEPAAGGAAAPAAPEPPKQYPVVPFKPPPGRLSFGLGVALFTGLFGALILGIAAALLRSMFWLIIVFPLLHGLLVGLFVGLAARLTKARHQGALAVVGVVCGLLSYFVVHYLFYLGFLAAPNAPQVGFWTYMDLKATEGVKLGRAGGGGAGNGIGYTGSVIYWLVEAVLTAGGAAGVAVACVGSPFCEGCHRWKAKRQHGPYVVEPQYAVQAVGAGVPAGLVIPAEGKKSVVVEVYSCPLCGDEGTLDVKATGTFQDGKNMMNWNTFVTYPGEALTSFEEADRTARNLGLAGKKK